MKKFISAILVSALAFGCVGCSLGTPKEIQKFLDVSRDNGFVKYEKKKDAKDPGAYQINIKSSSIEEIVDAIADDFESSGIPVPDADDLQNISTAQKIEDDSNNFFAIMYVFEDEDDAEDMMEECVDFTLSTVIDAESMTWYYDDIDCGYDTDDEACYFYFLVDEGGEYLGISYAMVLEDNTVYVIFGHCDDEDNAEFVELVDDFCDGFGFDQPSDYV